MSFLKKKEKKAKKKLSDLDKYCLMCIIFFILYTIAELVLSKCLNTTNDRLTEAVQWFCSGELFFCAMLKRLKIKKEERTDDMDSKSLGSDADSTAGNSRAG